MTDFIFINNQVLASAPLTTSSCQQSTLQNKQISLWKPEKLSNITG